MKKVLLAAILSLLLQPFSANANGNQLDYPHSTTNNVKCAECHYTASLTLLDPAWTNDPPAHIDDLPYNNFCWNCHDGSAAGAVETHSSRTTSDKYGQWNIECRTCHWPHHIMQYREYGLESFEASGTSLTVTSSTLTVPGNPWTENQYKGFILMPDTAKETFNYKILSNTDNEITVTGTIDTNEITAGSNFAIIYGNLVKATISTPNSGDKQVKFFRNQGANSFADGDATYNGPCEVCHTQTNHFRNNGTGPEQNHENIDGGKQGSNCVGICHSHANGFAHGAGSGGADGCVQCHGHEAGTAYDPDMQWPYNADPAKLSQGRGTTKSHSTHTEIDADDIKGPAIYCDDCHDINNIPYFKAGVDGDGDGRINLTETTVCDPCHTPGGMVDGINDPAVGVKNNWRNGIYEADSTTLAAGKDLWCISCHDEDPSNSKPDGSGVDAPNKAGDGSTYGYYLTGHGTTAPYAATLHGNNGPGYGCTVCHNAGAPHFDHAVGATRLKDVGDDGLDYTTDVSEVCLDCHLVGQSGVGVLGFDSVAEASVHSGGVSGSYNTVGSAVFPAYGDAADYSANPGYQCDACHEVHGTSKLAMVLEIIDGNVGGASNPVAVLGFEATDADMVDLDPTAAANDGVCDACHAAASDPHPDTNHAANHNQGNSGIACIQCHPHGESFVHGGGGGTNCIECHGHEAGTNYDPDMSSPYEAGVVASQGRGTTQSHSTHTEVDGNDARGPGIYCDDCHDIANFPYFKSGIDGNGDGKFNLAETDACNNCHTPGGTYDGIDDPAFGAKTNWKTGIYNGSDLSAGKELWCISCHDEVPSNSKPDGSGIPAPNKAGDGSTFGYYLTGHGNSGPYNATLHGQDGPAYVCTVCHDAEAPHFNHLVGETRLKPVADDGLDYTTGVSEVCLDCHVVGQTGLGALGYDSVAEASVHSGGVSGNYNTSGSAVFPSYGDDADYIAKPGYQCGDCHEVHGTSKLAMVLDVIDGNVGGASNPLAVQGFEASDTDLTDLDPTSAANDGVCDLCHAAVSDPHPDTNHAANHNQGNSGPACIQCHPHGDTFMHGGGGGTNCVECHGHEAGTLFDADMTSPYTAGAVASLGTGTTQSHSTHTETDADDLKGPAIYCADCHDINNFPFFKSGIDANADGKFNLAETNVCDPCHSPGGTYDGLTDPAVGAKVIWKTGAYSSMVTMREGKEKWCATCHDEIPADIQGVPAPNIVGNESVESVYGVGYGYYKTGHGVPSTESFPSSGGVVAGAGKICGDCHDFSTPHIDGDARTFNDANSESTDPNSYRLGYRLKMVSGMQPLTVPLPTNTNPLIEETQFMLCFDATGSGCHSSGAFLNEANMATNLVTGGVNRHWYHLQMNQIRTSSDYDGTNNSRITCVTCHNVHGSERLAMVRDGKITNREPGLQIWYANDDVVFNNTSNSSPPEPDGLPLSASTGTIWIGNSSLNLCSHCHGSNQTEPLYRTPHQPLAQAPTLSWTGENGFVADGVSPDNGAAGSAFIFRVNYTDTNNDPPTVIQVWIDRNDSGAYDLDELFDLSEADVGDFNFIDGKIYKAAMALAKAGDNNLSYRFYASDGGLDASGAPTSDGTISLAGNAPTLAWTGEEHYESDGVNPNPGGNGALYEFRISYSHGDNQCPPTNGSVEVWIDANDDAVYDALEKHVMDEADADPDCADGKIYSHATTLAHAGDGIVNYRFFADDGTTAATENAVAIADNALEILSDPNTPPTLSWVEGACRTNGVKPAKGVAGGDFEFLVKYSDLDNECPDILSGQIQVWVDANNNSLYESNEKHNLDEVDVLDVDCSDGKLYKTTRNLSVVGDGNVRYLFSASDGAASAAGPATLESIATVVNGVKVRPSGGAGWYSSIQSAINASSNGDTILVYEGTYSEAVFFGKTDMTVESVCGADETIIDGAAYAVKMQFANNSTLRGFSLTSSVNGLDMNGSNPAYVEDCKIFGNTSHGIYSGNSGTGLHISDTEIFSNTGVLGAGVYFNGGVHNISDSVIRNNIATENGGGVFLNATGVGTTFIDTIIKDNQAGLAGGGIQANNAKASFSKCEITGNSASTSGGAFNLPNSLCAFDFENSIIAGNSAANGGAFYSNSGATTFNNSTIADNTALGNGGAGSLNCIGLSMTNSVVWNNYAAGYGHNIYKTNCGGSSTIENSDIVSGIWHVYDFVGGAFSYADNLTPAVDPFFVGNGNYHILPDSGVIDAADSATAAIDDIDGDPRPQGAGYDMGADEALDPYVQQGAGGDPEPLFGGFETVVVGNTIRVPGEYQTIQEAVNAAENGDEIIVSDGLYPETIDFKGKAITVASSNGPGNCSIGAAVFKNNEGRNSMLLGFSFAAGQKAIQIINASPTVRGCVISGFSAETDGVIEIIKGSPLITACVISENSGAIKMAGAAAVIENTLIFGNLSTGVEAFNSSPTIVNSTIRSNASADAVNGGGIYSTGASTTTVFNSILWGNIPNQLQIDGGTANVSYSVAPGHAGEGNIEEDPAFVGLDDSRLSLGSPCIDGGSVNGAPDVDIDGTARPNGNGVDMGAYEM